MELEEVSPRTGNGCVALAEALPPARRIYLPKKRAGYYHLQLRRALTSVISPVSQTRSNVEFAQIDLCVPACARRLRPYHALPRPFRHSCRPPPRCVGLCWPLKFYRRPTSQQNINNGRAPPPLSRHCTSVAQTRSQIPSEERHNVPYPLEHQSHDG